MLTVTSPVVSAWPAYLKWPTNSPYWHGKRAGLKKHCRSRCPLRTIRTCAAPGGPVPPSVHF
ncbi:hypothetical protein [Streptomyces cuspidosporus]|uniref:Uncharacterized protein n=1 Tax=Streptomyces cuspidosporus TaxID=66882 RepID=A0ABP5SAQ7_9ACTN